VGKRAFSGCRKLTEMQVKAVNPPCIEHETFYEVPETISVYVPYSKESVYKNTKGWKEFHNIMGEAEELSLENGSIINNREKDK
jgi:hypothetical protein